MESVSLHARYSPPQHTAHPSNPLLSQTISTASGQQAQASSGSSHGSAQAASSPNPNPNPNPASPQLAPSSHHHHHTSLGGGAAFWRPHPMGPLVLPPGGKPVRVTLSGTPLLPGTLNLTGIRVAAMGGTQWFQPFLEGGKASKVSDMDSHLSDANHLIIHMPQAYLICPCSPLLDWATHPKIATPTLSSDHLCRPP